MGSYKQIFDIFKIFRSCKFKKVFKIQMDYSICVTLWRSLFFCVLVKPELSKLKERTVYMQQKLFKKQFSNLISMTMKTEGISSNVTWGKY